MHSWRNQYMVRDLFGLAVVGLVLGEVGWAQSPPKLTVCDVFKDLKAWSGKLIAVHGEVTYGDHFLAVSGRDCPNRPETEGVKWPMSIALSAGSPSANTTLVSPDLRSMDLFKNLLQLLSDTYTPGTLISAPGAPFEISATFVGWLRTSSSFGNIRVLEDGQKELGGGFGFDGKDPAFLIRIAVTDVTVRGLSKMTPRESDVATPTGPER